jgi:radical SAM protein with 4Fe4S-binding SPASM domain
VDEVNIQKEELELAVYEDLIDQAKELELELVDIAGGEPLVYSDIFSLIELITKRGIKVRLVSNGLYLNRFLANIESMDQIDLHVSLDSPYEEEQDKIRSYKGLYRKVRENIIKLQENFGPCVTVNVVVNKTNYKSIPEMLSYLVELGIKKVDFQPVMSVSKKTSSCSYDLTVEKLLETYKSIQSFDLQNSNMIKIALAIPSYLYPIIMKRQFFAETTSIERTYVYGRMTGEPYSTTLYVKNNGDVYLNTTMINNDMWKVGNIKDSCLADIWNHETEKVKTYANTIRNEYISAGTCSQCCAKRYCSMENIAYFQPYIENKHCSIMNGINKI